MTLGMTLCATKCGATRISAATCGPRLISCGTRPSSSRICRALRVAAMPCPVGDRPRECARTAARPGRLDFFQHAAQGGLGDVHSSCAADLLRLPSRASVSSWKWRKRRREASRLRSGRGGPSR